MPVYQMPSYSRNSANDNRMPVGSRLATVAAPRPFSSTVARPVPAPATHTRPLDFGTGKPVLAPRPPAAVCAEDPNLPRDVASRFGRRFRQLRQEQGLTQVEVAVHFGIDRTFLSDVERGRKSVCLPTLEVMALGFGLTLSDLLRGV